MIGAGMSTGISPFALLWPTFALVALILAVWLALVVKRLRHVKANPPTRNLANLFEMPVLYFALVPPCSCSGRSRPRSSRSPGST